MIRIDRLEQEASKLAQEFTSNQPFEHLVIDEFADDAELRELLAELISPEDQRLNKSRDYVFAKNKFEKSAFAELGPRCSELYNDLCSPRFQALLSTIVGENVFVDTSFFGGGLHQGGTGSFLDMHADFNLHPVHREWNRNLNVLLYLNDTWQEEWGGELRLRHKTRGGEVQVEPIFNRCVIMTTRGHTLHGYDPTSFPEREYRRSIACYAYTIAEPGTAYRSTVWYPDSGGVVKRAVGKQWPRLVSMKNRLFGSATTRNQ